MKTAEVALEYILAGLLALCAFVLPFSRQLRIDVSLGTNGALDTGAIVGVLGVAYLLGVVFDRAADTLLSPFEDELRIKMADKRLEEGKPCLDGDPFPQDVILYELREKGGGRLEWLHSLRSRIRTTRELAVLGLPAALGMAVHTLPYTVGTRPLAWGYSAVAFNLFLIVVSARVLQTKWHESPKTYDIPKSAFWKVGALAQARKSKRIRGAFYALLLSSSVVGIVTARVAYCMQSESSLLLSWLVGVFGALVALLAFTAWRRITGTYMKFISRSLDDRLKREAEGTLEGREESTRGHVE